MVPKRTDTQVYFASTLDKQIWLPHLSACFWPHERDTCTFDLNRSKRVCIRQLDRGAFSPHWSAV
jgi:hypothetical protein